MTLARLADGIMCGDISGIEFVHKSRMLREDRRGQSERCLRVVLRPHQRGVVGGLLQKIMERHIQAKRLRRQSG